MGHNQVLHDLSGVLNLVLNAHTVNIPVLIIKLG